MISIAHLHKRALTIKITTEEKFNQTLGRSRKQTYSIIMLWIRVNTRIFILQ